MSECRICGRPVTEGGLCRYHHLALNNLKSGYDAWTDALDISWEGYLRRLLDCSETGQWVVEVINHLLEEDESSVSEQSPSTSADPDH